MNSIVDSQNQTDNHIDRVIHALRSPIAIKGKTTVHWTLSERMEYYHVPGVSLAIIDQGQVAWAGGFGVKKAGTADLVQESTLFQAASISKPVTATAILRLVESGDVSLDEDVNKYLRSWKIPENIYTVQEKVTLRRILSHSAGLTVHGFAGYSLSQPVPTLQQILEGENPANSPAIRVDILPGSLYRYSGGGFTVIQQLLIDMMNEPFPLTMKRLVFEPAEMSLSTYEQPLPESRLQEAATGHDNSGIVIKGNWHNYPEMAAAGLWTTPTELAKWALEIAAAWTKRSSKLLSKPMVKQMMTLQKSPYGLGICLEGTDQIIGFSHAGSNEGFLSQFVMFPADGKGAVMMTNANRGGILFGEIFPSIAAEYHWPGRTQLEREVVVMETSQLDKLAGVFSVVNPPNKPFSYEVAREDDHLFVELKGFSQKIEFYPANINEFFSMEGLTIVFTRDNMGQAIKMNVEGMESIRQQSNKTQ
jgi:CubicO group peptidase (beta-lactamase class C family)